MVLDDLLGRGQADAGARIKDLLQIEVAWRRTRRKIPLNGTRAAAFDGI